MGRGEIARGIRRRLAVVAWLLMGPILMPGCAAPGEHGRAVGGPPDAALCDALRAVLDAQASAWNRGDIDGFMAGYWKSDELTFSAGGKTTRGWQATHDRYIARYPDRAAMGELKFSGLEAQRLDRNAALLLGRWELARAKDHPAGNFSLVFVRIDGVWRIVHDHTSSD